MSDKSASEHPAPLTGFVDPWGIACPTHKVGPGIACGFIDGDGAVCCWRVVAAGPKSEPAVRAAASAMRTHLVDAMTPELGPRMARVAVFGTGAAHPPPWRWEGIPERHKARQPFSPAILLQDANGATVLMAETGDFDGKTWYPVPLPSAGALAIIAAAPEIEASVRRQDELLRWLTPFAFAYAAEHPECNMPTKVDVQSAADDATEILARIDAAKAGG